MAYREVGMIEIQGKPSGCGWPGGARSPSPVSSASIQERIRRSTQYAEANGLQREHGPAALTEERLAIIVAALDTSPDRARGPSWSRCLDAQSRIEGWLGGGLRLTKVRKLLIRDGIEIPCRRSIVSP